MSNTTNEILFERAAYCIDYFEGKLPAILIENDLRDNDLDRLRAHVLEAEAEMARQEMYNNDAF